MKRILHKLGQSSVFRWSLHVVSIVTILSGGTLAAEDSWWQFRGPNGDGHTASSGLPLEWDETRNVAWKTAIHDRGWSSPVIWGNQVWVTTATRDGHRLFAVCVDKDSGRIVHDLHIFDVEDPMTISDENTYATPTPVIEEGRVFVHFGTYGTACLDTATGRTLWTRRDLKCDHEVSAGPASSPTLIDGHVVVHVDGRDVQYIIALDRDTGETVWKTPQVDRLHRHSRPPPQSILHALCDSSRRWQASDQSRRTSSVLVRRDGSRTMAHPAPRVFSRASTRLRPRPGVRDHRPQTTPSCGRSDLTAAAT